MLTTDRINNLHRLYWSERWPIRKIERHLQMSWRTIKKYLDAPAQGSAQRQRESKLDSISGTQITSGTRPAVAPSWSADASRIYFASGLEVYVTGATGGSLQLLLSKRTTPNRHEASGLSLSSRISHRGLPTTMVQTRSHFRQTCRKRFVIP